MVEVCGGKVSSNKNPHTFMCLEMEILLETEENLKTLACTVHLNVLGKLESIW